MLASLWDRLLIAAILAQDPAAPVPPGADVPAEQVVPPEPSLFSYLPLVAVPLLVVCLFFLTPDRQSQKRKEELAGLKKNDKVVTIGGLHGIVASVNEADDTVTLKIDETRGVVITVNRAAIATVVKAKDKEEKPA